MVLIKIQEETYFLEFFTTMLNGNSLIQYLIKVKGSRIRRLLELIQTKYYSIVSHTPPSISNRNETSRTF